MVTILMKVHFNNSRGSSATLDSHYESSVAELPLELLAYALYVVISGLYLYICIYIYICMYVYMPIYGAYLLPHTTRQ